MAASDPARVSEAAFWRTLYGEGADRWDLGRAHPALALRLRRQAPPPGRVAVPGCGRGHDARLLARHGHRVWGFDFAPEAVAAARRLAGESGVAVTFEERDVFTLAAAYPGFFDGVWEYTCFCAIDPARRAAYVRVLAAILKPGGWLLACFFPLRADAPELGAPAGPPAAGEAPPGPPFPVTRAEARRLLAPHFDVLEAEAPEPPAPGRAGLEWMVFARTPPARPSAPEAGAPGGGAG